MAGSRFVNPVPQFIDSNGEPITGGSAGLYFYEPGTLTLKATYTTSALSVANPQPVPTSSVGAPDREIWLNGLYRVIFKSAAGATVWDRDPVAGGVGMGGGALSFAATYADLIALSGATDGQVVEMLGYHAAGDGGGGTFIWNAASTTTADAGIVIAATGVATGRFKRTITDPIDIRCYGAYLDNSHDDYNAWNTALNRTLRTSDVFFANKFAGTIIFPDVGVSYVSQLLDVKSVVTILGGGTHLANDQSCIIRNPVDVSGIQFNQPNTQGNTTVTAGSGAEGSVIDGVSFRGAYYPGSTGTLGRGVRLRTRAILRNVNIRGYAQEGLYIVATAGSGGNTEGNANNWFTQNVRVQNCGLSGHYIDGADVNAGTAVAAQASANGGWGIWDSSFLGNTWVQPLTEGNTLGGYKSDSLVSNVFVNPYTESGQPAADLAQGTLVIGGNIGTILTASLGLGVSAALGYLRNTRGYESAMTTTGGKAIASCLGGNADNGDILKFTHEVEAPNSNRLRLSGHDFVYDYSNSGATISYLITGLLTTLAFGRAAAVPHAFASSRLFTSADANGRQITHAGAAPTSGNWAVGDVIFSNVVAAGGSMGWMCTTAGVGGSTAVFKAMPNVAA